MSYRKFSLVFGFIMVLVFASPALAANPINLLTVDESRMGVQTNQYGSINFNFVAPGAFDTVRGDLLNLSNFGPGGIVDRSVNILPTVSSLTPEALANADILVLPAMGGLSPEENTAVSNYVQNGGGLFLFSNWAPNTIGQDIFGTTIGTTTGNFVVVTDAGSPVINGPFGVVDASVADPLYLMWNQSFGSVGPYGHEILRNDQGEAFGVTLEYGSGKAVLFSDEELFMNPPAVAYIAAPNLSPRTEMLFLNSFAYAAGTHQNTVPEPATLLLFGTGLLGAFLRKR